MAEKFNMAGFFNMVEKINIAEKRLKNSIWRSNSNWERKKSFHCKENGPKSGNFSLKRRKCFTLRNLVQNQDPNLKIPFTKFPLDSPKGKQKINITSTQCSSCCITAYYMIVRIVPKYNKPEGSWADWARLKYIKVPLKCSPNNNKKHHFHHSLLRGDDL